MTQKMEWKDVNMKTVTFCIINTKDQLGMTFLDISCFTWKLSKIMTRSVP
jgi:hypothetical protein